MCLGAWQYSSSLPLESRPPSTKYQDKYRHDRWPPRHTQLDIGALWFLKQTSRKEIRRKKKDMGTLNVIFSIIGQWTFGREDSRACVITVRLYVWGFAIYELESIGCWEARVIERMTTARWVATQLTAYGPYSPCWIIKTTKLAASGHNANRLLIELKFKINLGNIFL